MPTGRPSHSYVVAWVWGPSVSLFLLWVLANCHVNLIRDKGELGRVFDLNAQRRDHLKLDGEVLFEVFQLKQSAIFAAAGHEN